MIVTDNTQQKTNDVHEMEKNDEQTLMEQRGEKGGSATHEEHEENKHGKVDEISVDEL